MGFRLYPVSVRVYSTFGGTCGYILRVTSPACSMALRWLVRTFWVMPLTDRMSSLNRFEQIPDDENFPFVSDEPQGHFRGTVRYFYSIIHIVSPPGISKVVWYKIDIGIIIYLRRKFDNGKGGRDMTRDMSRDMTRDMTFGEGDVRGILFMRVDPIITKN